MKLTLNGIKSRGAEKALARFAGKSVRIWSGQWRMWWRAESSGYTGDIEQAGVYTFDDAFARTKHCGPEKKIIYVRSDLPPSKGEKP